MKQDPAYFDGVEPDLIFVAKRLRDALALESLFKTTRVGAFFYVRPEFRDAAVNVLLANGYVPAK
jgi:hypothetical protein